MGAKPGCGVSSRAWRSTTCTRRPPPRFPHSSRCASLPAPADVLRGYFHAKDENRPLLLDAVFSEDAVLEVVNPTGAIAFPARSQGREAIADAMVRRFAQSHENVYSYYLASPPPQALQFRCAWLVGMTEKDSRSVRVGCGHYDWTFQDHAPHLASRLVITIEVMQVLPQRQREAVYAWLGRLAYPWTSVAEVARHAPRGELVSPVLRALGCA
jgi:hypothetical protein